MDMISVIQTILSSCAEPIAATLDGLAEDRLQWKPAPDSRSISGIVRHVIRVDNMFIRRLGGEPCVADPGDVNAAALAAALRDQQAQVAALLSALDESTLKSQAVADAEPHETYGGVLLHMAQHHLYHSAQIIYLRRALERDWNAPLAAWEHATHVIGDAIL